jgi:hypothetical protein
MIGFTDQELESNIQEFLVSKFSDNEIQKNWDIKGGTSQKILELRNKFRIDFQLNKNIYITDYLYRVFDTRSIYYKKEYLKTNSEKIMTHLRYGDNIAMILFRQQSQVGFNHAFVTSKVGDKNAASLRTREINYYFPLYIYLQANSSIDLKLKENK